MAKKKMCTRCIAMRFALLFMAVVVLFMLNGLSHFFA
ncbi:MAG: hypothetical protein ACJAZ4_001784 [Neptuniibacter pectenicola]|jgi:hypothetical protein